MLDEYLQGDAPGCDGSECPGTVKDLLCAGTFVVKARHEMRQKLIRI
jgi:hypothetical protein